MSKNLAPYALTENKAISSLRKALLRTWDDAQEAFDQVGESPIASQLNGLIATLADQTMYLIKADSAAGVYGLHEQALGLVNLTMGLKALLEDSNLGKAFDASHLVATAQLEGGMNIHVLNAFQLEENEEGESLLRTSTRVHHARRAHEPEHEGCSRRPGVARENSSESNRITSRCFTVCASRH